MNHRFFVGQVQAGERFVEHLASVMALFLMLAILGVGAIVGLVSLFMRYRQELKRLRDAHQSVTRPQESHLGQPGATALPGSHRESDEREAFQGAVQGGGYHGGRDSPSWLSGRLCG